MDNYVDKIGKTMVKPKRLKIEGLGLKNIGLTKVQNLDGYSF